MTPDELSFRQQRDRVAECITNIVNGFGIKDPTMVLWGITGALQNAIMALCKDEEWDAAANLYCREMKKEFAARRLLDRQPDGHA
jgi:hypothetical protein